MKLNYRSAAVLQGDKDWIGWEIRKRIRAQDSITVKVKLTRLKWYGKITENRQLKRVFQAWMSSERRERSRPRVW